MRTRSGRRARRWGAASCADGAHAFRSREWRGALRNRGDDLATSIWTTTKSGARSPSSGELVWRAGVITQLPHIGRNDESRILKIFDVEWHMFASLIFLQNSTPSSLASTRASSIATFGSVAPPRGGAFRLARPMTMENANALDRPISVQLSISGQTAPTASRPGTGKVRLPPPRSRPGNSPFGTTIRSPSHPPPAPRPLPPRSPRPVAPRPPPSRA